MKSVGYFLLMCGLLNAAAWGQSARKNPGLVMMRCAGLSCGASFSGRTNPEVKLGTFKSYPTGRSGIRTAKYEVKLGTFKSLILTKGL